MPNLEGLQVWTTKLILASTVSTMYQQCIIPSAVSGKIVRADSGRMRLPGRMQLRTDTSLVMYQHVSTQVCASWNRWSIDTCINVYYGVSQNIDTSQHARAGTNCISTGWKWPACWYTVDTCVDTMYQHIGAVSLMIPADTCLILSCYTIVDTYYQNLCWYIYWYTH